MKIESNEGVDRDKVRGYLHIFSIDQSLAFFCFFFHRLTRVTISNFAMSWTLA